MWKTIHIMCLLTILFLAGVRSSCRAQDSTVVREVPVIGTDSTVDSVHADSIQYFDAVSSVPRVQLRTVPDSNVKQLKESDDYWYADKAPQREKEEVKNDGPVENKFLQNPLIRTILWILLVTAFVGIVFWYLISGNIFLFRKPSQAAIVQEEEETQTEDIFSINFDKEITRAINAGQYRSAIRLLYLQTLKELSQRNIINYKNERTNTEYVYQLAGTTFYKNFSYLTRTFEYTWYGKADLNKDVFETLKSDFLSFKTMLDQ